VPNTFEVEATHDGVYVRGDIDLAVAAVFGEMLRAALGNADGTFFLDLAGVRFMDSTGIGALLTAFEGSRDTEVVVLPSWEVYKVLQLMGLADGAWNVELRKPNDPAPAGVA
jgi:anti-sigma B factor antagonist